MMSGRREPEFFGGLIMRFFRKEGRGPDAVRLDYLPGPVFLAAKNA